MSNSQRLYDTIFPELQQVWSHLRWELIHSLRVLRERRQAAQRSDAVEESD